MIKKKAVGNQGNWFAKVGEDSFPCVWDFWAVTKNGKLYYNDTGIYNAPKVDHYVEALRNKKTAILRKRKLGDDAIWESAGYIAMYEIDEIEYDQEGLRFRFVNRIQELK